VPGSATKPGPDPLIERHPYFPEICEFLTSGWSAAALNAALSRLHSDNVPVPTRSLYRYKKEHLKEKMSRPLDQYHRVLEEDRVLLDTIRERAALVLVQWAQVQRALDRQKQLDVAASDDERPVVSPIVRQEAEALVRICDSYDEAMVSLGLAPARGR